MKSKPPWEHIGLLPISTPTVFPVGPANVYLYPGPPMILFDAGTHTESAFQALVAALDQYGFQLGDIEKVVLTHHHLDHIGLARRIKSLSKARVAAHHSVKVHLSLLFKDGEIREQIKYLLLELGAPLSKIDYLVEERMKHRQLFDPPEMDDPLEAGDEVGPFEVHFRPGHSSTDTVYIHKEKRWAITGDHLIYKKTPSPLLRYHNEDGVRVKSLVQYYGSLLKTRAQSITGCFAGHGSPFVDHRHAVDATVEHIKKRCLRLLGLLPESGITPFEMTCLLFPRMTDEMLFYCLSTVTGHLELLETQHLVHSDAHDHVLHYFPVSSSV
ncbi:MAG: MBL fold metallo-hydrolase [Candidatus Hydrogenedentes bacterium]|nr:MBL fold metallo-hydrolase [Candidatus Hydrogenedentota bacterium]